MDKKLLLRNTVEPEVGKYILDCLENNKEESQLNLFNLKEEV